MKARAAVVNGVGEPYVIEELVVGEIQPDEVLVKMVATGICHSDEALRVGDTPHEFPAVLGHEGSGIIEQVGRQVKGFEVGDQVVLSYNTCGVCSSCKQGKPYSCKNWFPLNMSGKRQDGSYVFNKADGTPVHNFFMQSSFSSYSIVNQNNLVKVPNDVDLRMLGPLGCGFSTGSGTVDEVFKPEIGSSIAIFGTGAVGFGALFTAKISGCSQIIAIDIHDNRLETAKSLGATHTINSLNEDVSERIAEITGGLGVNYSIDTSGIASVMKTAIGVLAEGGVHVPIAVTKNSIEINTTNELSGLNKSVVGVLMGRVVPQVGIPKLVTFMEEERYPINQLVKFYRLEDINKANEDSKSGKTVKPILIIDEEYRKDEPVI